MPQGGVHMIIIGSCSLHNKKRLCLAADFNKKYLTGVGLRPNGGILQGSCNRWSKLMWEHQQWPHPGILDANLRVAPCFKEAELWFLGYNHGWQVNPPEGKCGYPPPPWPSPNSRQQSEKNHRKLRYCPKIAPIQFIQQAGLDRWINEAFNVTESGIAAQAPKKGSSPGLSRRVNQWAEMCAGLWVNWGERLEESMFLFFFFLCLHFLQSARVNKKPLF